MSAQPIEPVASDAADPPAALPVLAPVSPLPPPAATASRPLVIGLGVVALAALIAAGLLWQKLSTIQEQLARQSADAGQQSVEARTTARQAQEVARETAARQAVLETRLGEVTLQRAQLEDLMQSLSRSRDENLVVDIESALRLAQQQAQLTGSVEPLLAALRTADQRLARAAQPRLARLRAGIARDIDRIRAASVVDLPAVLARLDELARDIDDLPIANAAPARAASRAAPASAPRPASAEWWENAWTSVRNEARGLVRVSRIVEPEAALVAPEQAFFLRENLKLKLLNARLGVLARQTDAARADLTAANQALLKYFDTSSRRTQAASALLQQAQAQLRSVELPRLDETLAALTTAAAGR